MKLLQYLGQSVELPAVIVKLSQLQIQHVPYQSLDTVKHNIKWTPMTEFFINSTFPCSVLYLYCQQSRFEEVVTKHVKRSLINCVTTVTREFVDWGFGETSLDEQRST